jgi:hypothetical protein
MRNTALFATLALALEWARRLPIMPSSRSKSLEGKHAIEANQAVETEQPIKTDQAVEPQQAVEKDRVIAAEQAVQAEAPDSGTVVYGITREVCTVNDWGLGEVRRECVTEVLPPREPNPALEGICMIKYGVRTCYGAPSAASS